jgi:hypothetical protein
MSGRLASRVARSMKRTHLPPSARFCRESDVRPTDLIAAAVRLGADPCPAYVRGTVPSINPAAISNAIRPMTCAKAAPATTRPRW